MWITDFRRDLHYAFRILRKNPGYAITAIVCLGLGIGVNTTVFSWLDEMYFRQLSVPQADRIVAIDRDGRPPYSWREYRIFAPELSSLSGIAAIIPKGTFLDIDRVNVQIYAEVVSANYFEVLGIRPTIGRAFHASEDLPNSDPIVVISDRIWRQHFRRDPQVVGRTIRLEDQWYRIAGVVSADFQGVSTPLAIDAWVPIATYPHYRQQLIAGVSLGGPDVFLMGRLANSQSVSDATAEFQVVDSRMLQEDPRHPRFKNHLSVHSVAGYSWTETQRGLRPIATLLSAVVGVVLLIACVNVANLLLFRAVVRQREIATRRALGASRVQLLRQGITEGLVLSIGSAILGIAVGFLSNRAIGALLPSSHPDLTRYTIHLNINWHVALFTATISVICALIFSISPALENARADITLFLQRGVGTGGFRKSQQRDYLVIVQVALSLVLLISAGLLIRALRETENTDPGFATEKRMYIRLFTPENDFTQQQATNLYGRFIDDARRLPGVQDVTLSFAVFGFMDGDCAAVHRGDSPRKLNINVIEPNYFEFMRIPIVRGRTFAASDRPGSPRVIVINETMAQRWWPGEDPIGKTAWLGCQVESRVPAEVIGVVRDSKYGSLDEQPRPFYFVHWRQVWWNGFFVLAVHTGSDISTTAESLLTLARTGGPNLRTYELRTFDDLITLSLFRAKWQAMLLIIFSGLAITLSAVGLYGVVSYVSVQRTHEIGVRMALGAQSGNVKRMVLSHGLRLTLIGLLFGGILSAGLSHLLRRFLFGVNPLDPFTFAASALVWILIALAACYLPAWRASRVDPMIALRHE